MSTKRVAGGWDVLCPVGDSTMLWLRHEVSTTDTMAHLALKYDTTIGHICRANRMHPQDILQMHRHIWVPLQCLARLQSPRQTALGTRSCRRQAAHRGSIASIIEYATISTLPPHFYRESAPNLDGFAEESDPLLITTRAQSSSYLCREGSMCETDSAA